MQNTNSSYGQKSSIHNWHNSCFKSMAGLMATAVRDDKLDDGNSERQRPGDSRNG